MIDKIITALLKEHAREVISVDKLFNIAKELGFDRKEFGKVLTGFINSQENMPYVQTFVATKRVWTEVHDQYNQKIGQIRWVGR